MFNMKIGKNKSKSENQSQSSSENQKSPFQKEATNQLQETLNQSQSEASQQEEALQQELRTSSQATTTSPDHFDDLLGLEQPAAPEPSNILLTQDQFRQSFIGLHGMTSSFTGLKSIALPNNRINEGTANEIADTFYETILDIPMMHFMLQPSNKWLGRAICIGIYVQGMRGAISEELQERAKKAQPEKKQQPMKRQKSHDTGELSPDQVATLTGKA